jgi:hypothetical protein
MADFGISCVEHLCFASILFIKIYIYLLRFLITFLGALETLRSTYINRSTRPSVCLPVRM